MSEDPHAAEILAEVKYLRRDLDRIVKRLDHDTISKKEYVPVQRLVYGLVGTVLGTVLFWLLMLIKDTQ